MKYYFSIQLKIFHRHLKEQGIPIIFFVIFIFCLLLITYHFLVKFPQASFGVVVIAIWGLETFQHKNRIELLKTIFIDRSTIVKIRLLENAIICIPLLVLAIIAKVYWTISFLLLLYLFYSLQTQSLGITTKTTLPTPFRKYPFEMIRYFRIYLILILTVIFLFLIGLFYANTNLSIFAIALLSYTAINSIETPEPIPVIWNTTTTAKKFLYQKIKRITLQNFALITPLCSILLLLHFNYSILLILAAIYILCFLLITLIVLLKYSAYPRKIGILEAITLMTCGIIPILVLGIYPYYYKKAVQNLKKYLC